MLDGPIGRLDDEKLFAAHIQYTVDNGMSYNR